MKKLILLICCLLLCGCYDYTELNDISIVNGIGIDYQNDEYIVSLEIVKNNKSESSNEMSTEIVTGKDKVLAKAFNKAELNSEKKTMMEQVSLILVGQSLAKKGIEEFSDYIIRDTEISNNINMIVCKDPASLLSTKIENDSLSNVIVSMINNKSKSDDSQSSDLVAMNLVNKRKDIALPFVESEDEEIKINEIAYFKDGTMVDTMDDRMYNFLELDSANLDFNDEDNTFNIYKKKIGYEAKDETIKIKVKCYAQVEEISKDYNLAKASDYKKIDERMANVMSEEIKTFLTNTLKDEADLLGLREVYYKKYKKHIALNDIEIEIDTKFILDKNGAMLEVLYD